MVTVRMVELIIMTVTKALYNRAYNSPRERGRILWRRSSPNIVTTNYWKCLISRMSQTAIKEKEKNTASIFSSCTDKPEATHYRFRAAYLITGNDNKFQ